MHSRARSLWCARRRLRYGRRCAVVQRQQHVAARKLFGARRREPRMIATAGKFRISFECNEKRLDCVDFGMNLGEISIFHCDCRSFPVIISFPVRFSHSFLSFTCQLVDSYHQEMCSSGYMTHSLCRGIYRKLATSNCRHESNATAVHSQMVTGGRRGALARQCTRGPLRYDRRRFSRDHWWQCTHCTEERMPHAKHVRYLTRNVRFLRALPLRCPRLRVRCHRDDFRRCYLIRNYFHGP